ncbi:hypothetical protein LTR97_003381 [Elasticomyces elasticus]|uniref:Calcineurin-like phosphoesterase domain-containing protein n=1 Tax=Elasticomyces elasticus TaxID=574655 RepID=A0AAN8A427_9PEZI|nr:hypothetical protein LTR97_003381 [Elasticomyces elasticus]
MDPRELKKTSFLIMSDTHNLELHKSEPGNCPLARKMPKVDVLLHCGDLTQVGGTSAFKNALRLLGSFDAELKLVIAGNHDLELDGQYWRDNLDMDDGPEEHDRAVELMTGPLAKAAGVTYLAEGTHHFTLKNSTSFSIFASPYQPWCGEWAFGYSREDDHFGRANIPAGVDIMMTHGPPTGLLDYIPDQKKGVGCDSLLHAVQAARPKLHCFGHIHEGHGHLLKTWEARSPNRDTGKMLNVAISQAGMPEPAKETRQLNARRETLMVNAAIMDGRNKPVNAPWLIQLDL